MIKKGFSHIGIFFLSALALLPLALLYALSSLMYYLVYHVLGYRKKVVRENLLQSFPERPLPEIIAIEKQYYRYFCDLVVEIIKMSAISAEELEKRYTFKNIELIAEPLRKGQSIIICAAHYGNWEWGMLALGLKFKQPKYEIFKPLNNEAFDNWFYRIRARFGNTPVAMKQTLRTVVATREETSILAFASDQTPVKSPTDHWLTFLNQPTVVFSGAEKIAVQTNRPVVYIKVNVLKRGYYEAECVNITTMPQQTAKHEITAAQFSLLEKHIIANPSYWLWSHRRWKHKPENTIK